MEIKGNSRIAGIGAFLPPDRVTSESLMDEIDSTRFGAPKNYISKCIGIKERRISDARTLPSDMAIAASHNALEDAGLEAGEIDMILYCGIDRDWQEPATAHRVQTELGATRATVLDVTNACHGFMNGLAIADSFISNGAVDNVLVCTGEKPSRVMLEAIEQIKRTNNKEEFKRWIGSLTVGDAGGAMVVQRGTAHSGWQWMEMRSEGQHAELCYYRHTQAGVEGQMIMGLISRVFVGLHKKLIDKTYRALNWSPTDIDVMYCHQVGAIPHKQLTSAADLDLNCAPITYDFLGNLTSASIPVNMALNRPKRGDKLLVLGAGSGLSICQAGMIY
ncbi:ketoacyl-ACP synthase III [Exilibacterium tricleocarpae]|uniref:Ketoacyl-ACP synthase III n=1 Tax=Exilibacterium tricleocarpae TaxID=2591008 RepID=A0A545TLK5_9GAMM|nr:ketoacyl-ACP synthase III [Exilibacterium tricleocarpae]TQV78113.1 ketoacyl-ACP synthase III [Exilibacterium tricleocarpae]